MDLALRCVDSFAAFLALKTPWHQLLSRLDHHDLFQTFEWHESVLSWIRPELQLRILALYKGPELVGLAPLALSTKKRAGIHYQALDFIKCPDNQSCDLILLPQSRLDCLDLIANYIHQTHDWHQLHLAHFSNRSENVELLMLKLASCGISTQSEIFDHNWFISLDQDWQSYYATRSRRLKKGHNLVLNKLNRAHQWELIWLQDATSMEEQKIIELIVNLSQNSWKLNTSNSLNFPGPNAFIRTLTSHALAQGWLSLWILNIDGQPAAMEYQIHYKNHFHALRADIDQNYNEWSPGTLLTWKLTETLFNTVGSSSHQYDLGPGTNEYKKRWTQNSESLFLLTAYHHSLSGRLLKLYFCTLLPLVKTWQTRFTRIRSHRLS